MKVAVSALGKTLDSQVDPRFGRCQNIIIIDTDTLEYEGIENPNTMATGGAGIQTAQFVADKNVEAVLTGHCGPNAHTTLNAANIKVYINAQGSVEKTVEDFKNKNLTLAEAPDVQSHSGM